jgi:protein CLEC16A
MKPKCSSMIKSFNSSLFCEYNFLNEFIYLSSIDNREISLEIIKSFSMLILNLTSTTTLYYIFSNNFINHLLSHNFEKYDDEIIAYYINFIKSLSLKINLTSIQFFFQKQNNTFPLIEHAMKYYNHPDPMIKTTVRNIFLTLLKCKDSHYLVKHEPIYDYFSSLPAISYFPFIVCNLRDLIIKMNDDVMFDDKFKLLNDSHDEMLDLILYIQDIFSLDIERINYILINCLVYYLILPLLVGGIVSISKVINTNFSLS